MSIQIKDGSQIPKWTLHDGSRIPITQMSTVHIKRCVHMIEARGFVPETPMGIIMSRNTNKRTSIWLTIFQDELDRRAAICQQLAVRII